MKHLAAIVLCLIFLQNSQKIHAQCTITVDAGPDMTICNPPNPVQLDGSASGPFTSVTWSPLVGLSGANTLTPVANVSQTTTYTVTLRAPNLDVNLIQNWDFSGGTTSFSSDYNYSPGNLWAEGTYDVTSNPNSVHPNFAPCTDHSGDGQMMVINGAGVAGVNVYCQTVPVNAQTEYIFSAWACSVIPTAPAILQFSINGVLLGSQFGVPGGTCGWANFYTIWQSGANTSADICIVNQNTALSGNDFALDDFGFYEICKPKDSVKVHVINVKAVAAPLVVTQACDGANVTLSGAGSSTGANISYLWTTNDGNIVSGATTLNPIVNQIGEYTLNVIYDDGNGIMCEKSTTVTVNPNPVQLAAIINPPPPLGCSNPTATIAAAPNQSGNYTYSWQTSDGHIIGSATNAAVQVNQAGTYNVTLTNVVNGCTGTGSVSVVSNGLLPIANATGDTLDCNQTTAILSGTGSSTGNPFTYNWIATNGGQLSGSTNQQNATGLTAGTYILQVTNPTNGCMTSDTTHVLANKLPPLAQILPQGTIDCLVDTLLLESTASPANSLFSWTASGGGNIVSGATTPFPKVNTAGIYTLIITNPANGCKDTAAVTVIQDLQIPSVAIAPPNQIDCSNSSVNLSGSISSNQNFTFNWTTVGGNFSANQNTLNPTVNAAGNYILTVQNSLNGCTNSATATVLADQNAVTAVANAPDPFTCTINQVEINSTGSSSTAGLVFQWTAISAGTAIVGGQGTPTATASGAGTYQLQISNPANGCSSTDLVEIFENKTPPQVSIDLPATLGCAVSNLNLQANSTNPNVSFQWTAGTGANIVSGQNTVSPNIDKAGVYTVVATDPTNGCTAAATTQVNLDANVPQLAAAPPDTLTCQKNQVQIVATASPANLNFQWTGSGIQSGATTISPTINQSGQYILLATNPQNQCTATIEVSIFENKKQPAADAGNPKLLTCFQPTAQIGSPAAPANFQFQWAGAGIVGSTTTAAPTVEKAGIFQLTVTDPANGCSATDQVQITEDKEIPELAIALPDTLTCTKPQVQLTATCTATSGQIDFQWVTAAGNIISGGSSSNCTINIAAEYTAFSINLSNGCADTLSIEVWENINLPKLEAGNPQTLTCSKTTTQLAATADAGANFQYIWTTADGKILSGANTLNPEIGAAGNYVLQVSNSTNGCVSTDFVQILENKNLPTATTGADATLDCGTTFLNLSGAGSSAGSQFEYLWTTPNGLLGGDPTNLNPTANAPGNYILQVTDSQNGCTATATTTILKDENAPLANAGQPDTLTCVRTTLNLAANVSPGANFQWATAGGGNISAGQNSLSPTVNAAGTYLLTATNPANGCTSVSTVSVALDDAKPTANAGTSPTITCSKPTVSLAGTGSAGGQNFSISWTSPTGGIASGSTTFTPTVNLAGDYFLKITNLKNGCETSVSTTVGIDTAAPKLAILPPPILTCVVKDVPIHGQFSQQLQNFSAVWTTQNGHFFNSPNQLQSRADAPGTYVLKIENLDNGCATTLQTIVNQDIAKPTVDAGAAVTLTCDLTSAVLQGTAAGATNLVLAWQTTGGGIVSGWQTTTPTVQAAGKYFFKVVNPANGCESVDSVVVSEDKTPPDFALAQPATLTCLQKNVSLVGTPNGSAANFLPAWTTTFGNILNGQNSWQATADQPGTYILTVENQLNGCVSTKNVVVAQSVNLPQVAIAPPLELHCNRTAVVLAGSSTTAGNLTFNWMTPNGSFSSATNIAQPSAADPGIYFLTVLNPANGCTATDSVEVWEIPDPEFSVEIEQPTCANPTGLAVCEHTAGGQFSFDFSVDGGLFNVVPIFENLTPGNHVFRIRDLNGCIVEQTGFVEKPVEPTLNFSKIEPIEQGDSVLLVPLVVEAAGSPVVEWAWSPAADLSCATCPKPWAKPLKNTVFQLVITDANGCTATARADVKVKKERHVFVPNVFSPNGDGVNDEFYIFGKGVLKINKLRVFDRWGEAVFEAFELPPNEPRVGWKGDFSGRKLSPAVFVWWAEIEFLDGEIEFFKGDVTISR